VFVSGEITSPFITYHPKCIHRFDKTQILLILNIGLEDTIQVKVESFYASQAGFYFASVWIQYWNIKAADLPKCFPDPSENPFGGDSTNRRFLPVGRHSIFVF